jgi:hypothetical protein
MRPIDARIFMHDRVFVLDGLYIAQTVENKQCFLRLMASMFVHLSSEEAQAEVRCLTPTRTAGSIELPRPRKAGSYTHSIWRQCFLAVLITSKRQVLETRSISRCSA